jgi:hypothetical protein
MIQSCQRAINPEPHTKNHIFAPCLSLFSSFIPKIAPFLSKDTNHIESFEKNLYKKLANGQLASKKIVFLGLFYLFRKKNNFVKEFFSIRALFHQENSI